MFGVFRPTLECFTYLFEDVTTVDAAVTYWSHLTILLLYLIFARRKKIYFFLYFKYTFFLRYLHVYIVLFTKLVSSNNIIENVSIWPRSSILKPRVQSRFTFCLLVQIKWQFQDIFDITLRHQLNNKKQTLNKCIKK